MYKGVLWYRITGEAALRELRYVPAYYGRKVCTVDSTYSL
jgi:hypothetical protein